MPGSNLGSATADLGASSVPAPDRIARSTSSAPGALRRLARSPSGALGLTITVLVVAVGVLAPLLAPHDPFRLTGPPLRGPLAAHPLGTDSLGRDLLSGVIHGTRTTVVVAMATGLLVFTVGVGVGGVAGYAGGRVDDALMRLTELVQVLPRFFLAIVVLALFGPGLDRVVVVLGLTSWAVLARVVRAQVLSLKEHEFVDAARADGASSSRLLVTEILPNALAPAVAVIGLVLAQVILIEASLGFLGLGDPNAMSWGYLASEAQRFLRVAWWLSVFPGLAIMVTVVGLNLLGDALSDVLQGRR